MATESMALPSSIAATATAAQPTDWTLPGAVHADAAYLFAKPYRFAVMARNSDGVWSLPQLYEFSVLPAWWLRWWALIAYVVLIVALASLANRLRLLQLDVLSMDIAKTLIVDRR